MSLSEHFAFHELMEKLDVYEQWIFSKDADRTPAPYGWTLETYENLCEFVVQVTREDKKKQPC